MLKLLIMPPFSQSHHQWAKAIQQQLPIYQIVMPETVQLAQAELATVDAVFGWVPPDSLPLAKKLRWIQSPAAGPPLASIIQSLSHIQSKFAIQEACIMIILVNMF